LRYRRPATPPAEDRSPRELNEKSGFPGWRPARRSGVGFEDRGFVGLEAFRHNLRTGIVAPHCESPRGSGRRWGPRTMGQMTVIPAKGRCSVPGHQHLPGLLGEKGESARQCLPIGGTVAPPSRQGMSLEGSNGPTRICHARWLAVLNRNWLPPLFLGTLVPWSNNVERFSKAVARISGRDRHR